MSDHAEEEYPSRRTTAAHASLSPFRRDDCDTDDDDDLLLPSDPAALLHQHPSRLVKRPTKGPIRNPVDYTSLLCGLLAGIAQAGVFNPYDRALYLSVSQNRPFLSLSNWTHPYRGFLQSLGGRALSGGLYFPTEHFFLRLFTNNNHTSAASNFLAGTFAGAVNACVLNPLTAIKYKTWKRSSSEHRGMVHEAVRMLQKSNHSPRPFFNGLAPTLCRDVVFGGCYTWLRLQIQWWFDLPVREQWKGNFVAAGLATIVSGPFNYVRNVQYATSSREVAPSTIQVLTELAVEVRQETTLLQRMRLLQNRLRIGWGTARVAVGMAFAHSVYDSLQKRVRPYPNV